MILTRNTTSHDASTEIFNCYGNFSNATLLRQYGFIDKHSQLDTVSLADQLYGRMGKPGDGKPEFKSWEEQKRKYWADYGNDLIEEIARTLSQSDIAVDPQTKKIYNEWRKMMADHDGSVGLQPFLDWGLSLGKHGWLRFPCKVWLLILVMSEMEWKEFFPMSMTGKVMRMSDLLSEVFEKFEGDRRDPGMVEKVISLLETAIEQRLLMHGIETEAPEQSFGLNSTECFRQSVIAGEAGVCSLEMVLTAEQKEIVGLVDKGY